MGQLLLPAIISSFAVTIAVILVLRPKAAALGLMDRPSQRKHHTGVVPVIGGVAIFVGMFAGLVVLGDIGAQRIAFVYALFLLLGVGVVDDATEVPSAVRVLVQTAAVIITVSSAGLMIYSLGDPFGVGEISLGPFAVVMTLLVGLTIINAFNLIDGADGLGGTMVLIPLAAVLVVSGLHGAVEYFAAVVCACVLAYLAFNFPIRINRPVRTFMGDAGSAMLGLVVFWEVLRISQGEGALITPIAGLWLASIPVFDLLSCVVIRIRKGRSPFKARRDHSHHMLRRGGFSGRQKLLILGGMQATYAFVGVAGSLAGVSDSALFTAWCILGLSHRFFIKAISRRHRAGLQYRLRTGRLDPNRRARINQLR